MDVISEKLSFKIAINDILTSRFCMKQDSAMKPPPNNAISNVFPCTCFSNYDIYYKKTRQQVVIS